MLNLRRCYDMIDWLHWTIYMFLSSLPSLCLSLLLCHSIVYPQSTEHLFMPYGFVGIITMLFFYVCLIQLTYSQLQWNQMKLFDQHQHQHAHQIGINNNSEWNSWLACMPAAQNVPYSHCMPLINVLISMVRNHNLEMMTFFFLNARICWLFFIS